MRRILSPLWLAVLAAFLVLPTGTRSVAAWPAQGTIERAAELSAPAHRAPEAPRLQSDLGQGQGGARHDRSTGGILPEQIPALATRDSSLAGPVLVLRSVAERALRGAPHFPTGPPARVS